MATVTGSNAVGSYPLDQFLKFLSFYPANPDKPTVTTFLFKILLSSIIL
jgi:hypothetical protein